METTKNTPAFPCKIHESERPEEYTLLGLTKREYFAALAMQSLLTQYSDVDHVSQIAVRAADSILIHLEQTQKTQINGTNN